MSIPFVSRARGKSKPMNYLVLFLVWFTVVWAGVTVIVMGWLIWRDREAIEVAVDPEAEEGDDYPT